MDRVAVEAMGETIYFETADARLRPSPEAFAGLFLLPALKQHARLRVEAPLDGAWLLGTKTLTGIYASWWKYPATYPIEDVGVAPAQVAPAPGHGLCFTGGVDSFYALHEASSRYDHLVFVHGYDIDLADGVRIDAWERSLRDVALDTRKQAVLVRTNLRSHPVFSSVPWERTHGAALAAVGQLLAPRLGHLSIPPSWSRSRLRPWGSHPETDQLWSSSHLGVLHGNAGIGRRDRLLTIAGYPLAQRHLRVCWEHRTDEQNCSRCEKCVRTMTALAGAGVLDRFRTFSARADLPAAIRALGRLSPGLAMLWQELLALDLPPDVRRETRRLVRRSRRWWPFG